MFQTLKPVLRNSSVPDEETRLKKRKKRLSRKK